MAPPMVQKTVNGSMHTRLDLQDDAFQVARARTAKLLVSTALCFLFLVLSVDGECGDD